MGHRRVAIMFFLVPVLAMMIALPASVHGAGNYNVSASPPVGAEGSTITFTLTVTGALALTTYQFTFMVTDPGTISHNSSPISHTTGLGETSFTLTASYPGPSFSSGQTSLPGSYNVQVNQNSPLPLTNVAATSFVINLTDKTTYLRTQTVTITATGYSAGTGALVTIKTAITSLIVYSHSTAASTSGQVSDSWQIPKNATTTESYIATVTGTPLKTPSDSEAFSVQTAPMTIPSLVALNPSYQRTENLTFSFNPSYPSGQAATTGQATIKLTSPTNSNQTLTAVFNATTQSFLAIYKTTRTDTTGTWTARLSTNDYDDGFGNTGPSAMLTGATQLQPSTLTVIITVKSYFLVNEPIKFNATITYPDGSDLQSGNVTTSLSFSGGGYTTTVPTIFDSTLQIWRGTYNPIGNEPGGLWSLTITGSDASTPADLGVATRVIQLGDRPPVASIIDSPITALTQITIQFNATGSYDPDGTVVGYSWNFGDGTTGSGFSVTHTYATAGTYSVTLTVTDNSGSTGSANLGIVIQDRPPIPTITSSTTNTLTLTTVYVNSTGSYDPDGNIVVYSWNFGDGSTASGASTSHSFSVAGSYTVNMTATDNNGSIASASLIVTIQDRPPIAIISSTSTNPLTGTSISFDGTSSSDPDGNVVSYAWNFGDGSTGSGPKTTHAFATAATYTVNLTITDNNGSVGSASLLLAIQDRPPIVTLLGSANTAFTGTLVSFNSTGTYDPDGSVVSYSWNYGDGLTGSGPTTSHSFTLPGTYSVNLTATDNSGSTTLATFRLSIQDRHPIAVISNTQVSTVTGSPVSFDGASSSDLDDSIVSYRWDFGDGATATGASPTHVYSSPGNYTVRLTVTDSTGLTGFASSTVNVSVASPASSFTFYFAILAAIIAGIIGALLFFRRRKVTLSTLKVNLDEVKSEADKIEDQQFFQSMKDQLKKEREN